MNILVRIFIGYEDRNTGNVRDKKNKGEANSDLQVVFRNDDEEY